MTMPLRPRMPTPDDEYRIQHLTVRLALLAEDYDDHATEWMTETVQEERIAKWGPPDTAINPMVDLTRALTTPGLYGVRPIVQGRDGSRPLIEVGGLLDRAGWSSKLQTAQYKTIGAGDYFVRPKVDARGQLHLRLVSPAQIWQAPEPGYPDRAQALGELRLRFRTDKKEWGYFWDLYDLESKRMSIRVALDETDPRESEDITAVFMDSAEAALPTWSSGEPYIPFIQYRAVDDSEMWHWSLRRGVHRATLQTAMFATYMARAALDASGSAVVVIGAEPPAGTIMQGADGRPTALRSLPIEPGCFLFLPPVQGSQALIQEVGPGANLPLLQAFVGEYVAGCAAQYGLAGSDLQRTSADGSSGFALFVSERGKRQAQQHMAPIFRPSDELLLAVVANQLNTATDAGLPEDGYSITYQEMPASPQEQREEREATDWALKAGHISEVEAYMRHHPGVSEEAAEQALVEAQVRKARLQGLAETRLRELGLTAKPKASEITAGQMTAALEAARAVGMGQLTPDAGAALVARFLGVSTEEARQMVPASALTATPAA